jgi:hypothetical protein
MIRTRTLVIRSDLTGDSEDRRMITNIISTSQNGYKCQPRHTHVNRYHMLILMFLSWITNANLKTRDD